MRTTIRIDDQLLRHAREHAARTGRTLTAVVEDALRLLLSARKPTHGRKPVKLTTFRGKGIQPGVDLDNSASLLDAMDEGDGPR